MFVSGHNYVGPRGISSYSQGRAVTWTFATPVTGADSYQLVVPQDALGNDVTWTVNRVFARVSTPSSGATTFQIERSTAAGAFAASSMLSSALTISGSGTYENSTEAFAISTLASGTKVRVNFSAADATHAGFVIVLELGYTT